MGLNAQLLKYYIWVEQRGFFFFSKKKETKNEDTKSSPKHFSDLSLFCEHISAVVM